MIKNKDFGGEEYFYNDKYNISMDNSRDDDDNDEDEDDDDDEDEYQQKSEENEPFIEQLQTYIDQQLEKYRYTNKNKNRKFTLEKSPTSSTSYYLEFIILYELRESDEIYKVSLKFTFPKLWDQKDKENQKEYSISIEQCHKYLGAQVETHESELTDLIQQMADNKNRDWLKMVFDQISNILYKKIDDIKSNQQIKPHQYFPQQREKNAVCYPTPCHFSWGPNSQLVVVSNINLLKIIEKKHTFKFIKKQNDLQQINNLFSEKQVLETKNSMKQRADFLINDLEEEEQEVLQFADQDINQLDENDNNEYDFLNFKFSNMAQNTEELDDFSTPQIGRKPKRNITKVKPQLQFQEEFSQYSFKENDTLNHSFSMLFKKFQNQSFQQKSRKSDIIRVNVYDFTQKDMLAEEALLKWIQELQYYIGKNAELPNDRAQILFIIKNLYNLQTSKQLQELLIDIQGQINNLNYDLKNLESDNPIALGSLKQKIVQIIFYTFKNQLKSQIDKIYNFYFLKYRNSLESYQKQYNKESDPKYIIYCLNLIVIENFLNIFRIKQGLQQFLDLLTYKFYNKEEEEITKAQKSSFYKHTSHQLIKLPVNKEINEEDIIIQDPENLTKKQAYFVKKQVYQSSSHITQGNKPQSNYFVKLDQRKNNSINNKKSQTNLHFQSQNLSHNREQKNLNQNQIQQQQPQSKIKQRKISKSLKNDEIEQKLYIYQSLFKPRFQSIISQEGLQKMINSLSSYKFSLTESVKCLYQEIIDKFRHTNFSSLQARIIHFLKAYLNDNSKQIEQIVLNNPSSDIIIPQKIHYKIQMNQQLDKIMIFETLDQENREQFYRKIEQSGQIFNQRFEFIKSNILRNLITTNKNIRAFSFLLNKIFDGFNTGDCEFLNDIISYLDTGFGHTGEKNYVNKEGQYIKESCFICQRQIFIGGIVICRICGHGGHSEHITKYFKENKTCPNGQLICFLKYFQLKFYIYIWQIIIKFKYQQNIP
ncbi:hypothetical protein PPERSA_02368 [Pseudocohnilembus persalinus]|uniref:Uncharacterized protein n=1 Tax=Pseudocohnilembus persalinus TaxID=266149 RepID=A0A0V0QU33_PSEPJ|nr:hypothetical protein PPERSA_02368 [Pseudocohnilembus persalinus]|eukprot:KRX05836.1 hypothetical protein PPERSA_02368 [Pseudocohnilembus persalinus]